MMQLPYYGLFKTSSGLPFLFQQGAITHLLGEDIWFEAKITTGRMQCPHNIRIDGGCDDPLPDDDLVKEFLPLPDPGGDRTPLYMTETMEVFDLLGQLLRLSMPTEHRRNYFIWDRGDKAIKALRETNLQPPIIMGFGQAQSSQLTRLANLLPHLNRRAIILGPEWLVKMKPTYVPYSASLASDLSKLQLEEIGVGLVRRYLSSEI